MHNIVVDISDYKITDEQDAVIITHALGSCIAVIIYDPVMKVGGMIHYMLPLSSTSPEKAKTRPAMFADTGVPLLFKEMYAKGCQKKDMIVKVAGGGKLWHDKGQFEIGKRNYTVLRKIFWKNSIMIKNEDVGGSKSRTTRLYMDSGRMTVSSKGEESEL